MDFWPLPLFPDGSLASSVITTVWVGVLVVCLFNLRFGWVLSGLVVPGYIVPLLIAKPVSAVVVLFEASVTYGVFWIVSERLSGPRRWGSFFGRDRFMGLILVSVAVRLLLDGWLLPVVADLLDEQYGFRVHWQHNLHSFGLVVVALLANQLWKPGYLRGMPQVLVMIAITFLIVRFGLMELTNFRVGAVVYLYEDFASSVLASPKAYIILITTCFIASRMNLRYGWDFSGILIPALLALQWYQPWKIVTSFVEALIIYFVASAVLSARIFAGMTIEGARKVLLFFNISFAYKLLLGHGLAFASVEQRITDYYGFGYLLPTLIALKAHDKGILTRVSRATLQISFKGALAGSLAGFLLTFLVPDGGKRSGMAGSAQPTTTGARVVAVAAGTARLNATTENATAISAADISVFRTAVSLIDSGRTDSEARALLRQAGFNHQRLARGRSAIVQNGPGGFALLFNPLASRGIALHVPDPAATPRLAIAGYTLFERQDARWLLIGGVRSGEEGPLRGTAAAEFLRAIEIPLLEVRPGRGRVPLLILAGESASRVDLRHLRGVLPHLRIAFGDPDAGISKLLIPVSDVRRLAASEEQPIPINAPERFTRAELAFIRFDLLDPLLENGLRDLAAAATTAAAVGIELGRAAGPDGEPLIALRRVGHSAQLYLLQPRGTGPVLHVAADEGVSGTAANLFRRLNGRALLIVPDRLRLDGEETQLLPLITQAIVRRSPEGTAIIQIRRRPGLHGQARALLAVDRIEPVGGFGDRLVARLRQAGIAARLVQHGPETAGLEIAPTAHLRYLQQAQGGRVAALWIGEAP